MKSIHESLQHTRQFYTTDALQISVSEVADSVAVGYVREQSDHISCVIFLGKQRKPDKYFNARGIAEAGTRVTEMAAGALAQRRAADHRKTRATFHDHERAGGHSAPQLHPGWDGAPYP